MKHSYRLLDYAIALEKATPEGFLTWVLLHAPYFGDPGDPSIVAEWRKADDERIRRHDAFVDRLAEKLRNRDLYVVWPARLSVREEKRLEQRNNEFYEEYQQIKAEKRGEGLSEAKANRQAIDIAAARHGYKRSRAYEIVQVRGSSGKKAG